MFKYSAFGLTIQSEINFPELVPAGDELEVDVHIRLNTTPSNLDPEDLIESHMWVSPEKYLYEIEGVARFYVVNGSSITVEPDTNAQEKSVRIYLLCNAMAAIIHQRGLIPLHASGIVVDGQAILILGDSGAGKSTTIKALVNKGHKIFTDDVCVLKSDDDLVYGIPSYPMMKLWENSFQLLGLGETLIENKIWKDIDKYGTYFHTDFITEWLPISKIIILNISNNEAEVQLKKTDALDSFIQVASNTYRKEYVDPMNLNTAHFNIITRLVSQCAIFEITRPVFANSINLVVKSIEQILEHECDIRNH